MWAELRLPSVGIGTVGGRAQRLESRRNLATACLRGQPEAPGARPTRPLGWQTMASECYPSVTSAVSRCFRSQPRQPAKERIVTAEPLSTTDTELDRDAMVGWFARAEHDHEQLIGTEQEKFGVVVAPDGSLQPVEYERHIAPLLAELCRRFGWQPSDHGISGEVVGLSRGRASITLEPGGQLELSGEPLPNLHATCAEFTSHQRELDEVATELGLAFFAAGFHPFATRDEINWMPKGRYRVMRNYLPTRGHRALDMMLRTCTVQANFDYASERQCGERLRIAMASSALVSGLFANSPFLEGARSPHRSTRSAVWSDVDPDRCGLLEFVFDDGFSYEKYVDWVLDVPMFFVRRDGEYLPHHVSFREFWQRGFVGPDGRRHRATMADWELHASTVFPEVRLKPYIEVRGADSVALGHVCSLPAFCKGLMEDDDAVAASWELLAPFSYAERLELWEEARRDGLTSKRVRELTRGLYRIARETLDRIAVRGTCGRTEARFLDPLDEFISTGRTPADIALESLGASPGRDDQARRAFVRHFHFAGIRP